MTTRRWMRLWALLVLWCLSSAQAGEPTTLPLLRLETGVHTASVRKIATDATGRWAVTVSHDKTARIWDLATSRLLGVLRVPQENGREGKLNSVAISPDGEYIAVSGQTTIGSEKGNVIYIFERLTQNQKMRVTNISNIVTSLAYSPDGRWIAAGLIDDGVRIFDSRTGQESGSDPQYKDSVYSVEFSPKENSKKLSLLSASYDGQVRLHEVNASGHLALTIKTSPSGGQRPFSARFSPDGERIAVGFDDTRSVQVFNVRDFSLQATLDTKLLTILVHLIIFRYNA